MIYLINDEISKYIKTIFVCQSEEEVLNKLSDVKNLKKFKGQIKVVKVVL